MAVAMIARRCRSSRNVGQVITAPWPAPMSVVVAMIALTHRRREYRMAAGPPLESAASSETRGKRGPRLAWAASSEESASKRRSVELPSRVGASTDVLVPSCIEAHDYPKREQRCLVRGSSWRSSR